LERLFRKKKENGKTVDGRVTVAPVLPTSRFRDVARPSEKAAFFAIRAPFLADLLASRR
jgi:hypothetical protein